MRIHQIRHARMAGRDLQPHALGQMRPQMFSGMFQHKIRMLVRQGAQIMVCGGRDMAAGVRQALDQCLAPLGLSADSLKQKGLYLEDAY